MNCVGVTVLIGFPGKSVAIKARDSRDSHAK
jgi:hypothetical protein